MRKREGGAVRRGSRVVEGTKCCWTVTGRFSSSILHSFFRAGFWEARAVLRNARVLPAAPPSYLFRAQTSRHRHLFAGLFGCNRSCALLFICHLLIYIHSCLFVSVSIRVSCVDGPCPCVSLLVRNRASLSLFPLLSPALWFKTPVVPPRFSAHARCNATYLVNPK